jgi:uncharacterized protein with HEPN domain
LKRTNIDYIEDIATTITNISEFITGMDYNDFSEDKKTEFAVIRALEIIGEATKSVPDSVREKYPDIPWKSMAGMRDKLAHAYFGVRLELVWNTATELLPPLKEKFELISQDLKKSESDES